MKSLSDLDVVTQSLEKQADTLSIARNAYLTKEAERKHFEATLIQGAAGKSHAERLINAQATKEWLEFQKALARFQAVWEFQKLKYEVLDKEWLAQYATLKSDAQMIKRHGAVG